MVDTEQLVNDLGDTLDAVDGVAGQLCVCIVPTELLPSLHNVRSVMSSWVQAVLFIVRRW